MIDEPTEILGAQNLWEGEGRNPDTFCFFFDSETFILYHNEIWLYLNSPPKILLVGTSTWPSQFYVFNFCLNYSQSSVHADSISMGTMPWSMAILPVAASSKNSDCTAAATSGKQLLSKENSLGIIYCIYVGLLAGLISCMFSADDDRCCEFLSVAVMPCSRDCISQHFYPSRVSYILFSFDVILPEPLWWLWYSCPLGLYTQSVVLSPFSIHASLYSLLLTATGSFYDWGWKYPESIGVPTNIYKTLSNTLI